MEINKTTVYTLTKSDIQEVCYSLFVQKLKALGVNAYFEVGDVKLLECAYLPITDLLAELIITEKETL